MKVKQIYPKVYLIICVLVASLMPVIRLIPLPASFSPDEVYVYRLLALWFIHAVLFVLGLIGLVFCRFGYPLMTITLILLLCPIAALFSWAATETWHFAVGLSVTNIIFAGVIFNAWTRISIRG